MSTCYEQLMGNNSIKRIFHPFHHQLNDMQCTCLAKGTVWSKNVPQETGVPRWSSLSEFLLSLGWFQTPLEDSKWNTLQKVQGMTYFTKNDRPDSQVTSENCIRFVHRNLLAMVQATWTLILSTLVHFYTFLHLSRNATGKYTMNVVKEGFSSSDSY